MNVPCEIIQDLLPLYVEEMTSDASSKLVEEHLRHCSSCSAALRAMKKQISVPQCNLRPLARIRQDINKKRGLTVAFVASILAIVLLSVFSFLSSPEYFSNQENLYNIVEYENSDTILIFDDRVTGYRATRYTDVDGNACIDIMAWSTILDRFLNAGSQCYRIPADADIVFLCSTNPNYDNKIIWSNVKINFDGAYSPASFSLGYLAIISAALVVIFGIFIAVFRKRSGITEALLKICGIPMSYLCGYICIKGLATTSFLPTRDFVWIIIVMVFWYIAFLSGYRMVSSYRESNC